MTVADQANNKTGYPDLNSCLHALQGVLTHEPDAGKREYGAFIYEKGDKYFYGPIVRGSTMAESKDGIASTPLQAAAAVAGIPKGSTLLGTAHLHPLQYENGQKLTLANGPSGGDVAFVYAVRNIQPVQGQYRGYAISPNFDGYIMQKGTRNILEYSYVGPPGGYYPDFVDYKWVGH